jgi:hypothetical protein
MRRSKSLRKTVGSGTTVLALQPFPEPHSVVDDTCVSQTSILSKNQLSRGSSGFLLSARSDLDILGCSAGRTSVSKAQSKALRTSERDSHRKFLTYLGVFQYFACKNSIAEHLFYDIVQPFRDAPAWGLFFELCRSRAKGGLPLFLTKLNFECPLTKCTHKGKQILSSYVSSRKGFQQQILTAFAVCLRSP